MARNRRKHAHNLTYDPRDPITHGTVSIRVFLTDPDEQDRAIYLNLSDADAHLLAHRLLHHVAAIETDRTAQVS